MFFRIAQRIGFSVDKGWRLAFVVDRQPLPTHPRPTHPNFSMSYLGVLRLLNDLIPVSLGPVVVTPLPLDLEILGSIPDQKFFGQKLLDSFMKVW